MIRWTINDNGKLKPHIDKTKKSLLVSYDMIPLIGLRNMEKRLIGKGMIPTKVKVVKDNEGKFWGIERNGKLDLSWDNLAESEDECYYSTAICENLQWFIFTTTGKVHKRTEKVRQKSIMEINKRGIKPVRLTLVKYADVDGK